MGWNFRKIRFENFGQPLEVVFFPGKLEIPGIFCSIGHSISNFGQTLGPSPSCNCRMKDGRVKSLFITVASVFFLRMICHSFYGICTWMTMGMLHCLMLPWVSRKQSGTTRTISLNAHFFVHDRKNCRLNGFLNLVVSKSVISKTSLTQSEFFILFFSHSLSAISKSPPSLTVYCFPSEFKFIKVENTVPFDTWKFRK